MVVASDSRLPGVYKTVPAAVFLILFLANLYGRVEPPSSNRYPLAERSLAYQKMLAVQRASFHRFEELARRMPAYYDHFTHYRIAHPETGWSGGPVMDGTPVGITPDRHWEDLANMPEEFVMLIEAEWLGGEQLAEIKLRALNSDAWDVQTEVFANGEFRNEVVVVRRASSSTALGARRDNGGLAHDATTSDF